MPSLNYYQITAAGSTNNNVANATAPAGSEGGPIASLITSGSPCSFGNVLANTYGIACIAIGVTGGTISDLEFLLFDYISDIGGDTDAEDFKDGTDWDFRIKVLADYVAPSSIVGTAATWDAIPTTGPYFQLGDEVLGLTPGNDGTNNLLVDALNFSGVKMVNAFVYIAVKPHSSALDGLHVNWSFKGNFVYP